MATSPMPPVPPDIMAQQAPPVTAGMPTGGMQEFQPLKYAEALMQDVAKQMNDVAQVIAVAKPSLLPKLKAWAQMGGDIMNDIQAALPQPPQGGDTMSAQAPSPPGAAAAISMG